MKDPIIGYCDFLDGWRRPVYLAEDGRQYVIDGDGQKVYGVWFIPPDDTAPTVIVNAAAR